MNARVDQGIHDIAVDLLRMEGDLSLGPETVKLRVIFHRLANQGLISGKFLSLAHSLPDIGIHRGRLL